MRQLTHDQVTVPPLLIYFFAHRTIPRKTRPPSTNEMVVLEAGLVVATVSALLGTGTWAAARALKSVAERMAHQIGLTIGTSIAAHTHYIMAAAYFVVRNDAELMRHVLSWAYVSLACDADRRPNCAESAADRPPTVKRLPEWHLETTDWLCLAYSPNGDAAEACLAADVRKALSGCPDASVCAQLPRLQAALAAYVHARYPHLIVNFTKENHVDVHWGPRAGGPAGSAPQARSVEA